MHRLNVIKSAESLVLASTLISSCMALNGAGTIKTGCDLRALEIVLVTLNAVYIFMLAKQLGYQLFLV